MKRFILLALLTVVTRPALAQKTEHLVSLNAGLFSFKGVSAEGVSQINLYSDRLGYTNNPFGAARGLSGGLSYQVQRISRNKVIIGIGAGYEILRSRTAINAVNGFDGKVTFQEPASGRSNLSNHFINGYPYAGYRAVNRRVFVDLTAGFDLGFLLRAFESGEAVGTNGVTYRSAQDRTGVRFDLRPRFQVSAGYARVGAYAGYAYGLRNYRSGWVGGPNQCRSELIRFGLTYKIRG